MSERDTPQVSETARRYAARLLRDLGHAPEPADDFGLHPEHPAVAAARCGLTSLSGAADAAPQLCPAPLAACADGALAALASLAPPGTFSGLRGSALLTERAAVFGHTRQGARSPGESCRLLEAADGRIALNLARPDDWALLPAWLETDIAESWEAVAVAVRAHATANLMERARELGLAVAVEALPVEASSWLSASAAATPSPHASGERVGVRGRRAPRVLDLSSLWAGPLCTHLLQACGAEVIKLESLQRPDGARNGPSEFFDLLNAGKRCVALDFSSAQGRAQLRALIERADVVVEASRPRAMRQLGIDAEALVRERTGLTWISLTGYGRRAPQDHWIAYGDDAGIAAGLSALIRIVSGQSVFVGDAIADPVTGVHAALAAWASYQQGGSRLISLSLVEVLRHCIGFEAPVDERGWRRRANDWHAQAVTTEVAAPTARAPARPAAALGADTDAVLREWGIAC